MSGLSGQEIRERYPEAFGSWTPPEGESTEAVGDPLPTTNLPASSLPPELHSRAVRGGQSNSAMEFGSLSAPSLGLHGDVDGEQAGTVGG